uniref:Protein disulfide-isomerase TMX3 n=1 Tax=Magallana gigas TaxID=29159 RepID=K1PQT9_MAGGI
MIKYFNFSKYNHNFYAPWCGHCKKLEPIYRQVADTLKSHPVKVAKIDCTRFSSIASVFDVSGFPTIKFPPVRSMASIGKFNEGKLEHKDGVFFLYLGDGNLEIDLYDVTPTKFPTVLVIKDRSWFEYSASDASLASLEQWINGERFTSFPKASGGNINDMAETGKSLVMIVVNPEDREKADLTHR